MKTEWQVFPRPDGSLVAKPREDLKLKRYVLFFPNKSAAFKEVGEPMVFLGTFDTIEDAIRKVMKQ